MREKGASTVWVIIITILVIAAGVFIYAQVMDEDTVNDLTPDTSQEATDETTENDEEGEENLLSRITDDPESYHGQTVTVSGEIQDLLNRRVFKISDQIIGDELLVVTRTPLTEEQAEEAEQLFADNASVTVNGILRQLVVAEIESEYDVDLTEELEVEYTNKPVLIADTFTFSEGNLVVDFRQAVEE